MIDRHTANKEVIAPLRAAMYHGEGIREAIDAAVEPKAEVRLCHPLGSMAGSAFYERAYAPLLDAVPDLERRDSIVVAGPDGGGADWVGCCGFYCGSFIGPWLDIPPTGHLVHMRFHEFFRIDDGRVAEIQAVWDIPEVMIQANAWPMAPSLGREWRVPGPAAGDGIVPGPRNEAASQASVDLVIDMLEHMMRHPEGPPEDMEMERYWHPRMNWYGPSGIGTGRGIEGFRNWHQIPFLNAMPDRGQHTDGIALHFFGDGDYAAVTGWPAMVQTLTGGGWMGIAPAGRRISLRSLDFWRIENGKIRENWVMVDLLDAYAQLGVDVFCRLREFNKARNLGPIKLRGGR